MSDNPNVPNESVTRAQRIDEQCDAFESAWGSGQRPKLEDALAQVVPAEHDQLLRELLPIDIFYRLKNGEEPRAADYAARFPALDSVWIERVCAERGQARPTTSRTGSTADSDAPTMAFTKSARHSLPTIRYFGDYELLDEIARGGMGVVYKARQVKLNRIVAVKMILSGQLASPADVERFHTEAEAAAQLDHPGIVPIYEVGQHEGHHYFSMGFVEGQGLSARVAKGPSPVREAAEIVRTVAEAVQYAHDKGVIHRDLKPGNILLGSDGKPRVTDFGLAKLTESGADLTGTGQILGTPSFMPPEQAAAQVSAVGRASDIYSLGAVLYCLLTGRPPFQAATALETLLQVQKQEPISPRQLNPAIPLDLDTIILKCLDKSPSRRYRTARDLSDELTRYLEGRPITARRVSRTERFWRWCKREPVISTLSAAVLLALIIGTAVSSYFALKERQRAEAEANERHRADAETIRANAKAKEALENATREREQRELADAANMRARRHLYAAHMNLAQAAWEDVRVGAVVDLLERQQPRTGEEDLRGFEWHYWNRLCHANLFEISHASPVRTITFSPDGQRLISASADGTIKTTDVATGRELMSLKVPQNPAPIVHMAFSPDGRRLASANIYEDTVKIWDAATGQQILALQANHRIADVAFSPDGKRLASEGRKLPLRPMPAPPSQIKVWNAESGEVLLTLMEPRATYLAFSPDGTRLATSWQILDSTTGQEQATLKGGVFWRRLVFSPDGKRLAGCGPESLQQEFGSANRVIRIWNAATGEELLTFSGHIGEVQSVAFSPDSLRLVSAGVDQTVKLWDTTTGQALLTLKGHTGSVECVAFSPDGKLVASGSSDGTLKVWDPAAIRQESTALDGYGIGRSGSGAIRFAFTPNGARVAASSRIFDPATGQELSPLNGERPSSPFEYCFSLDGKLLASVQSSSDTRFLKLWDAATGLQRLKLDAGGTRMMSAAFSPDGKRIAAASQDGAVKVWETSTGQQLLTLSVDLPSMNLPSVSNNSRLLCVTFSPDGKRLAWASISGTIKVWNSSTGDELLSLQGNQGPFSHPLRPVYTLAFSLNGKQLAWGSADGAVTIWDAISGQELLMLKGHTSQVNCVVFSPNGQRLATASDDGTNKIWDTATGQELLSLKGQYSHYVAFSPDGNQLVSGNGLTITIWNATPKGYQPPAPTFVSNSNYVPKPLFFSFGPQLTPIAPPNNRTARTTKDYDEAIRLDPTSAVNYYNRATALEKTGESSKAIADYTEAIGLNSKHSQSLNALARLLATSPDDSLRDGKKAVEHATTACELTEWTFAAHLDTLAAAYAETGNFELASKWATKAIELATGSRKDEYKARLELYQSGKPYHLAPASKP